MQFWRVTVFFLVGLMSVAALAGVWLWPEPNPRFAGGFESGEIDTEKWQIDAHGDCGIEVVSAPVREGRYALKISSKKGQRCELVPRVYSGVLADQFREPRHVDRWYSFSVYLPPDWTPHDPNGTKSEVVAQWHGSPDVFFGEKGGRGPPLSLRIREQVWFISFGWEENRFSDGKRKANKLLWTEPYTRGAWTDWVFHVKWSYKADGMIEVWKNGESVARRQGPNAYNDIRGTYLKIGMYHPSKGRVIYHDDLKISSDRPRFLVTP